VLPLAGVVIGACGMLLGQYQALATVSARQILGGPTYDTLIAFTAVEHDATLLSLDQRATPAYEAVGATVEQLAP